MNPMQQIKVEKLTLNVGAGKDAKLLEKGIKVITSIAGTAPVKTITQKRIPGWGLRPGLPIGCKLTLRGEQAQKLIPRLLVAKENKLSNKNFDEAGNISFGIPEYIDIEGAEYDPKIGIIGLQACITLSRPGYRIKTRRIRPQKVKKQRVNREDAVAFMNEKFQTKVEEEQK